MIALFVSGISSAQIRVVSYNSAQFNGDPDAMSQVLLEASNDDSHGFAVPVSVFLFQEVDEAELSTLQSIVSAEYTMATFTDQNDSSWGGAQAMFYRSSQFDEDISLHEDIYTGASRHADRWGLDVLGYENKTLFVYSMHLKSSTGSSNQEIRRQGAENVRDDIVTLPLGSHVIVVGDMNFYSPDEPGYSWFTDAGDGQVIDPLGSGNWSGGSNALKHTQSPLLNQNGGLIGGGLDDRFDFQLISTSLYDGGGFDFIEGTYRSLGNDGNHYNDAINAGNNHYFPGDTARSNALADELIISSDHLPLIVDYQVPAIFGWNLISPSRVIVGANTSVDFTISNDAEVVIQQGADILNVDIEVSGDLTGDTSVSVPALSSPETVSLPINTSALGNWNAAVTLACTSPEAQTTPETVKLAGEVIDHSNASFSFEQDVDWFTYEISFDSGTGIQSFNVWLFNYGYDGEQSLLEIDEVTIPEPPLQFMGISTNTVGSLPALLSFEIDTDSVSSDTYTSFLPISISDEDLPGEQTGISMLTVRVEIVEVSNCEEDFDNNGQVDIADLLVLIGAWGSSEAAQDLDGNGQVGVSDLLILIAAWGFCQ